MTVKQKQSQLKFLGYYPGAIDGIWGDRSKEATANFQDDFGLEDDGVFGALTEEKSAEIIKEIQTKVGAAADGVAGSETESATKKWQAKNDLEDDGIAGERTREKMGIKTVDFWDTIRHFKRVEFECRCGRRYCNGFPVEIDRTLIRVADRIRSHFGKPATVSSGVRCSRHNSNVGGVANSRHKLGKAMDFSVSGVSSSTLLAYVKKQPEIRYAYAIDSLYVHMDVK